MLKVGEIARMAGVSVRTLHHYDEIGLLRPQRTGPNGYRYYAPSQLADLRHILEMRTLGLSLEAVRRVLDGQAFEQALLQRREELLQQQSDTAIQLSRLDEILTKEHRMKSYQVELRDVPAVRVLSAKGTATDFRHVAEPMGMLFKNVFKAIESAGIKCTGPCIAIWGGGGYQSEQEIELEVVVGIDHSPNSLTNDIREINLEPIQAACTRHEGSYERFGEAYAALLNWMSKKGYEPNGRVREVYIHHDDKDAEKCVSELHIPVKRV